MLNKLDVIKVIEANLAKEVSDATRIEIAGVLGIPSENILLGTRFISIIDGSEMIRLQVTEAGAVTVIETDIEVAVAVLNDCFHRDPLAMWLLCNNRVQASADLAVAGAVRLQEHVMAEGSAYSLNSIDLLNSVLYALTGQRVCYDWDTTGASKGDIKFVGFKVQMGAAQKDKAPLGVTDLSTS